MKAYKIFLASYAALSLISGIVMCVFGESETVLLGGSLIFSSIVAIGGIIYLNKNE